MLFIINLEVVIHMQKLHLCTYPKEVHILSVYSSTVATGAFCNEHVAPQFIHVGTGASC